MPGVIAILAVLAALVAVLFLLNRTLGRPPGQADKGVRQAPPALPPGKPSPFELLDDPREAAAILLVQVADYEGLASDRRGEIVAMMAKTFECSAAEAEGFFAAARRTVGRLNDVSARLSRVLQPIKAHTSPGQQRDLLALMGKVAGETPSLAQQGLIDQVRAGLRG